MTDDLTVALVAGLLGGGVTGAIVGGFMSLVVQRRAFDNERAARFAETRRDRYAELFAVADRMILRAERGANLPGIVARGDATAAMATRLAAADRADLGADRTPTEVAGLVAQIQLLGPPAVGAAAQDLASSLHELSVETTPLIGLFNVSLEDPDALDPALAASARVTAQLFGCKRARATFLAAARQDIGLTPR